MAEQIFQIGIKGIIRNSAGDILLLQGYIDTQEGWWDIPGGRMDPGETFEQTLSRELLEEIGVTYTTQPLFFMAIVSNITLKTHIGETALVLMAYKITDIDPSQIHPQEANVYHEWVTPAVAAECLRRKYPQDFCTAIAQLSTDDK